MKTAILAICAAVLGGSVAAGAAPRLTPQQRLDGLLAGRVAGKPVPCLPLGSFSTSSQIINQIAIVYGSGRTIYVNRPTNVRSLDDDYVMITKIRGSSSPCQLDTVELRDRASHVYSGFVVLNDFVPYTRAGK